MAISPLRVVYILLFGCNILSFYYLQCGHVIFPVWCNTRQAVVYFLLNALDYTLREMLTATET